MRDENLLQPCQSDYRNDLKPAWCPGCSFYNVLFALTAMTGERCIDPSKLIVVSGIGCSSRLPLYLSSFGLHTLHGRALPVATGARMANPEIPVIVIAGDGDLFSIGTNHFIHAARRNIDITVICMDNGMYAMTGNQASPTSAAGYHGSLDPCGTVTAPIDVIRLAIACNASFVARSAASEPDHLRRIMGRAFDHCGFSFVEVVAPCRTYTKQPMGQRLTDINTDMGHDPADEQSVCTLMQSETGAGARSGDVLATGVFREQRRPSYEELLAQQNPAGTAKDVSAAQERFYI